MPPENQANPGVNSNTGGQPGGPDWTNPEAQPAPFTPAQPVQQPPSGTQFAPGVSPFVSQPEVPAQPPGVVSSGQTQPEQQFSAAPIPQQFMPSSGPAAVNPQPMPGNSPKNPMVKIILWVVAGLVVIGLAGFGVHELQVRNDQKKTSGKTNSAALSAQSASGAADISKLQNFSFAAPAAAELDGLQQGTSVNNLTTFVSSDAACTLAFGKTPQSALAGTTLGDVIAKLITKVKGLDPSVKVSGPNNVAARVLKGTDGKSYSLPTANFSYTGSESGQAYSIDVTYSISQLGDGSHAVVLVECTKAAANATADVLARVQAINPVANAIKVQVE